MVFLSEMKNLDRFYRFKKLSKISKLILTVPHLNAEEEKIFNGSGKQNKLPSESGPKTNFAKSDNCEASYIKQTNS